MVGDLSTVPLSALTDESRNLLSSLLNTKKVIPCECPDQITRNKDWRGLASLANITSEQVASIHDQIDKTAKVLELWIRKNDGRATIGYLIQYLQWLDRFDVYDDIMNLARQDLLIVSQANNNQVVVIEDTDENIITFDDKRYGTPQLYNAYVLFAKEDKDFVDDMIARLRSQHFKICTEDDLLPGHATEFEPVSRLISERCRYIILVYSPDFLQSPAITFYMNLAQADGINKKQHKIIPVMYRECTLPKHLSYYHNLRYSRPGEKAPYNFWHKLERTLESPQLPRLTNSDSGIKIAEISNSISNGYTPVKAYEQSLPALPSIPIETSTISDLLKINDTSTFETTSISSKSESSEEKKKKGVLRKIYNIVAKKKHKDGLEEEKIMVKN